MKEKRFNEIKGVIFVALGIIVLASLVSFTPYDLKFYTTHPNIPPKNLIRTFGAYLAGGLFFLLGWTAFLVPVLILWFGVRLFKQEPPSLRLPRLLGILVFLISLSSLLGVFPVHTQALRFARAGALGTVISHFVILNFGRLGGYILFTTLIILSVALVTEILISTFFSHASGKLKNLLNPLFAFNFRKKDKLQGPLIKTGLNQKKDLPSLTGKPKIILPESVSKDEALKPAQAPKLKIRTETPAVQAQAKAQPVKIGDYHLPPVDLLDSPPPFEARQIKEDLTNNARVLEDTLEDFGISVKVTDIERGPIITRYELEPAPGVKLNRIVALGDDIALAMKAQSVRIVAPIPGKARVGVEVPNIQSSLVYFKEILGSQEFLKSGAKLTLAIGKDISGKPVFADLGKMPHLLIAGTTGSGKTVCVNSLILSLLFRATPEELKFVMIDPKMVELAPFNGLPHLLCPVVTDAKKASSALGWAVNEMEDRYKLLADAGARNIEAYNEKQPQPLPYIVIMIDEFADLMMICRDQIESAITRLAQLSRAVGIHIVLATQRPSVDVITGVIKANLPARISFKVASKVDSRTVLDMNGADKLLGKGDMLFLRPEEAKVTRAQGALVSDAEIEKVVEFIKAQGQPVYSEEILKDQQKSSLPGGGEKDELYEEAVRIIIESNQASVSILQRRLRLGYTRAARIIDMMEQEGMVGPFEGSKPRKILVDRDAWLEKDIMEKEKS
ncbi:MAG: DNA translocase FtsK [Candidatus Omnitrophica bacterium]|nr:DNA translocase FtsK [Candidatus Omnitrophota bacterium]